MRTSVRILVAMGVLFFLLSGPRAHAACHAFTVSALSQVAEGNKVEVTIERDADVNESSVRVTTVNGTAKAPGDFTAVDQRVSWPAGGGTSKKIMISTTEDTTTESSESFSVKVSEGDGCNPPNPNFTYGPPAKITIQDDDTKASTPTPVVTPAPRAQPLTTATASPSPTPTATPKPTKKPKPSPTPTLTALAVTEEDDDGVPWLPVAAVAGFLAAGAGALMLTRMRPRV